MAARTLPLARYERFHTHEVDDARTLVTGTLPAFGLHLAERGARLDARMNAMDLDRIGLCALDYGAEVLITPNPWESCFLVMIPLSGTAEVSHGQERIVSTTDVASVLSPTERLTLRWAAGTPQLITRFDRAALESHLSRMIGREVRKPLDFSLGMDLRRPACRSWMSVVGLLRQEVESDGAMLSQPLAVSQLEGLLMTQLLLAQPSNYTTTLLGEQPRVAPRAVKRAMELIEGHAAEPLTVEDIAEAVGVGVRALQEGFRRHLETTPMAYLRDVRLDRVRAELAAGAPGTTTVTDVAFRWGFVHLGRFSLTYRRRFGETPSETLRD
ncbi:AraC family transcriptional regulator [Sphaerimonospora sp. CA-214678]|uniref:AraC family transcriptional regulator n=1 Tax=Sphaerimonospora sp. CA-214678 TaxID=3240029 RepID=UPI003D949594